MVVLKKKPSVNKKAYELGKITDLLVIITCILRTFSAPHPYLAVVPSALIPAAISQTYNTQDDCCNLR